MTGATLSTPRLPDWLADAIVRSLSGIALGLFLAFAVLPLVRWFFPAFQEWSIDRGMRINAMLDPVAPNAVERALGIRGYLFVDVDAGDEAGAAGTSAGTFSASQLACNTLSNKEISRQTAWDCAPWRPLNRFLLASIIDTLRSRGAKLIVADVVLDAGGYPLPADESAALIAALRGPGARAFAVLAAEPRRDARAGEALSIQLPASDPGLTPAEALAIAAPALPYPGDILRRYVGCYGIQTPEGAESIPSVATRAEATLRGIADARRLCGAEGGPQADKPARIAFTLPEVGTEAAAAASPRDGALWNRYHLFLDRCRAIDLLDSDSSCSQSSLFRDKITVIGASSRARGDRHLTPLGEMSGSMVVLNAIRSRLDSQPAAGASRLAEFRHDLAVCARAACVWFIAFVLLGLITQKGFGALAAFSLRFLVVVGALAGVLWVGVKGSFSVAGAPQNLNLMVPLLAFGLEMYTNAARHLESFIERPINQLLGRSHPHG